MSILKFKLLVLLLLVFLSLPACGLQDEFAPLEKMQKKAEGENLSAVEESESLVPPTLPGSSQPKLDHQEQVKPARNKTRPESQEKTFHITARQFGFWPNLIEVNQGDTVELVIESIDVKHGFAVPKLGVDMEVPARDTISFKFIAKEKGAFAFLNDVYSGAGTKDMKGTLVIR